MGQWGRESRGTKGGLMKGVNVLLAEKDKGRLPRKVPSWAPASGFSAVECGGLQKNQSGGVPGLPLASDCLEVSWFMQEVSSFSEEPWTLSPLEG